MVQLTHITGGGVGAKPHPLSNFGNFLEKNSHFKAIRIKFRTVLEPLKKT